MKFNRTYHNVKAEDFILTGQILSVSRLPPQAKHAVKSAIKAECRPGQTGQLVEINLRESKLPLQAKNAVKYFAALH